MSLFHHTPEVRLYDDAGEISAGRAQEVDAALNDLAYLTSLIPRDVPVAPVADPQYGFERDTSAVTEPVDLVAARQRTGELSIEAQVMAAARTEPVNVNAAQGLN